MSELENSKVSEAVETVWHNMLGLPVTLNPIQMGNRSRPTMMIGFIQITGAWQGAIKLECSAGLARRLSAIMFGADPCEITPDQVNDALGELTNMIGGNVKSLLPEPNQLSMPAVTEGTDYLFSVPGSKALAEMSFTCEGKPFHITILQSDR
jgi:chemotaxis protein CheX